MFTLLNEFHLIVVLKTNYVRDFAFELSCQGIYYKAFYRASLQQIVPTYIL